ncbi:MAG TPA: DUF222 domain-containing protein [Streptosporangiaceae bacterium]|nr:DUF222 domain-containing protein [Streptosporangiaceae bacterium]
MPQDPFPDCEPDGEEPDGSGPLSPDDGDGQGPEQGLFVCLPAEELTLSGFNQDGRADTMAPGALLATLLEAITGEGGSGLAGLADDQLIGVISAARRMESRASWTLMAGLAELARRRPPDGPADSGRDGFSDFAPDEVAAELHLTNQSAAGQMAYACGVTERLPLCFAALAAGRLHPVHLRIIEDETALLSAADAARADAELAELAPSLTFGRLRALAHRLVLRLDPDSAQRRKEAAKQDAHVRRFREESGNAGMVARELPPDEVLASWQHVEQRALDLRAAGIGGSLRELRVQAYLDLLQERDSRLISADPRTDQIGCPPGPDDDGEPGGRQEQDDSPGGNSGRQEQDDSPGGLTRRPGRGGGPSVAALVNITVPLSTLLGESDNPAEAAGFGLIDPEDVRDLVAAAARHPYTRWCVTALHPDGTAVAHGCARGRHPPPAARDR